MTTETHSCASHEFDPGRDGLGGLTIRREALQSRAREGRVAAATLWRTPARGTAQPPMRSGAHRLPMAADHGRAMRKERARMVSEQEAE